MGAIAHQVVLALSVALVVTHRHRWALGPDDRIRRRSLGRLAAI